MGSFATVLEQWSDKVMAAVGQYDALGKHPGEKGERRENAFADIISEVFPDRFRIGTGEVVSADGQVSKQIDILIFDALNSPVLIDSRDSQIVPAESVYAAIELKPNLKSTGDLRMALDNIRSIRALPRTAIVESHGGHHLYHGSKANPPIYGAILTYGEHWPAKRIGDEMASYCKEWPRELWTDQVCVVEDSVIVYGAEGPQGVQFCRPGSPMEPAPKLHLAGHGKIAFGFFLLEMLYWISQMDLFPPDLQKYLNTTVSGG